VLELDLIMKKILPFFLVLTSFFFFKYNASAQGTEPFISDYNIAITVNEEGIAHVKQQIVVTNQTIDYYLKSFVVSLGLKDFSDIVIYDGEGVSVSYSLKEEGDSSLLTLTPSKGVVGMSNKNIFNIEFDSDVISKKKGLMWEIIIPGVESASNLRQYNLNLSVPQSFGPPTRDPSDSQGSFYQFNFSKKDLLGKGQIIDFGKYQLYNFDITYALRNPNLLGVDMPATFPPTIPNVQKVFFESITPRPQRVEQDSDGNQLAYFKVPGGKTIHPRIKGQIIVFSSINNLSSNAVPPPAPYIKEDEFWPVGNPEIVNIAGSLENASEIYDYVIKKLVYKEKRPNDALVRAGSLKALAEGAGVCTEYTDLLVTLLRAKGISAQSLAGFAYTEEPPLPPLSNDNRVVLHSWVRWYDPDKGWQYTDPTWGNTTGLDYFNKFDTNHVVFAIHGASSTFPYSAGSYIEGGEEELEDKVDISLADSEFENNGFTSFEDLEKKYTREITNQRVLWQRIAAFFILLAVAGTVAGAAVKMGRIKNSTR